MNYDFDTIIARRGTNARRGSTRCAPISMTTTRRCGRSFATVCRRFRSRGWATYLAWVDATPLGVPSAEIARRLEHEAKVKFSPGAIYGEEKGAAYLRINLACPRATLLEALERTISAVQSFSP